MSKKRDIDVIEEVQKFNPFHDGLGRFSSSNGFKTYSANPNTKAGAMAIARSAAGGHGSTLNVHRESYGENIRQNANWLGRGKQANNRQQANATLRTRIEPATGLAGASQAGAIWQQQNQMQGRTTGGNKAQQQQKPAQQQQKPAQQQQQAAQQRQAQQQQQQQAQQQNNQAQSKVTSLEDQVANVTLHGSDPFAIQLRGGNGSTTTNTTKVADDHFQERVAGKDISGTVDLSKMGTSKAPIDAMAEAQGWNKGSTVTNDLTTFQKAAAQSGYMVIRSVHDNSNTGESANAICKKTMADGDAALGGGGGQWYGSGLYMVGSDISQARGRAKTTTVWGSQNESFGYGDTQMMATFQPGTRIATPQQAAQLHSQFFGMSRSERARFGNDENSYIASKGYDGARWHDDSTPYLTVYNKSALIYYGEVASKY